MNIRFYIKIIVGLLIVKFAFAEVIDVDDQEMIKLSNANNRSRLFVAYYLKGVRLIDNL